MDLNLDLTKLTQKRPEYNNLWYVAHIYSIYQISMVVVLLFFPQTLPEWFKDYIRAASIIVAIGWLMLYFYVGPSKIEEFYKMRFPWIDTKLIYFIDIMVHFVPVFLVGLPRSYYSYFIAFGIILVWYVVFRPIIQKAYAILPLQLLDFAFFLLGPLVVLVITIIHYISQKNRRTKNRLILPNS